MRQLGIENVGLDITLSELGNYSGMSLEVQSIKS